MYLFNEKSNFENFRKFAEENNTKFFYAQVDLSSEIGFSLANMIGVKHDTKETMRIIRIEENQIQKYIIEDLSIEGIKESIDKFEKGELKIFFKS